jgi:argininosuccinate lyase
MSHIRSRFSKKADELVVLYTSSLPFDWRLYSCDIEGSLVHAKMLTKQEIISDEDYKAIKNGLNKIEEEIENGEFQFNDEMEDIHMAIEGRLLEIAPQAAAKLHTARSRNDQVALDMRLYLKDVIITTVDLIGELQLALVEQAEANKDVIMPGFTHLQAAQPILLAHHLLAYFEMLKRDAARFCDCFIRTDVLPLGSGALAGTTYATDRLWLAKELDFKEVSKNSMDAVSDRDFVLDYLSASSLMMMHLSRLAEELVLWASPCFDFTEIDDAYATASSIMPQKKNPDVAELLRGKTGRVYGSLMALLTTIKALPLAYNRDLQEDKEGLFDTIDTILLSLQVCSGMINTLKFKPQNMRRFLKDGYILATDIADYLVKKGEAFRDAHAITAKLVNYAIAENKELGQLSLKEYKKLSPYFSRDVFDINLKSSIASRDNIGGTSLKQVNQALNDARKNISE